MDNTSAQATAFHDVPVEILVSVGQARLPIRDLLELQDQAVLPLDRKVEDPVDLYIGERLIARGRLEEAEGGEPGQLAVHITEVIGAANGGA